MNDDDNQMDDVPQEQIEVKNDHIPEYDGDADSFQLRYYVGHTESYGHEFFEFAILHDGTLRYANDSKYRQGQIIRKEVTLNSCVVDEFKKLIVESHILESDDSHWPDPSGYSSQELEIIWKKVGDVPIHLFFKLSKLNSMVEIKNYVSHSSVEDKQKLYKDLQNVYYLAEDLKAFVYALMNLHCKVNPL